MEGRRHERLPLEHLRLEGRLGEERHLVGLRRVVEPQMGVPTESHRCSCSSSTRSPARPGSPPSPAEVGHQQGEHHQ
jgi:hypothetical protein